VRRVFNFRWTSNANALDLIRRLVLQPRHRVYGKNLVYGIWYYYGMDRARRSCGCRGLFVFSVLMKLYGNLVFEHRYTAAVVQFSLYNMPPEGLHVRFAKRQHQKQTHIRNEISTCVRLMTTTV